jgi:hypothetical protein
LETKKQIKAQFTRGRVRIPTAAQAGRQVPRHCNQAVQTDPARAI